MTSDGAQLRLTDLQRQLICEALMFHVDRPDGDRDSIVCIGVDRASAERMIERVRGGELQFRLEEIHVLFSALISASAWILSEEAFYERIGFFREHALALASGLVNATAEVPDKTGDFSGSA
ncbi:hypothetical protein AB0M92_36810 [Streptomyces sp. NPDC051582]|uniref:hypothetical protein n=1 Tax=Streptomyces sp. NPDC051582 TaxID=3155167 RepID=UPI00342B5F21